MNEGRQRLRRLKRAAEDSLEDTVEEPEGDFTPAFLTDWREIPLEALERKELRQKLREAVDSLPKIYREVFVLRDLQEMNQEETAAALGITITAVKVRLHRARMMLQKNLVPYLQGSCRRGKASSGGCSNELEVQKRLGTHLGISRSAARAGSARRDREAPGKLRSLLRDPRFHAQCADSHRRQPHL